MFSPAGKALVDCSDYFVAAERRNDALDLAPVAEAGDIAVVAAALGAHRGLEPGIVAVAFDQVGGIGERDAAVDEWAIHAPKLAGARFPTADDCRQRCVSHLCRGLPPLGLPWR